MPDEIPNGSPVPSHGDEPVLGKGLESLIPARGGQGAQPQHPSSPHDNPLPPYLQTPELPSVSPEPMLEEPMPLKIEDEVVELPQAQSQPLGQQPLPSSNYERYLMEKAPRAAAKKMLDGQAIFQIETDKIKPNPYQPRRVFDDQALRELASSIRDFGFLQPLVVSKTEHETPTGVAVEYQLIAGERRWLAAQILGLERVPVIIRTVDLDRDRLELAIIENLQRENLNPVEMARAFSRLQDEFHLTQREIAAQLGKSREAVANTVRLLDLPIYVQDALAEGKISESHGRLLLGVTDQATQKRFFEDLLHTRITTRELKDRVKATQPKQVKMFHDLPPELKAFQERLTSELGAPVKIEADDGAKGTIHISFYSEEELQQILHRLSPDSEGGDGVR